MYCKALAFIAVTLAAVYYSSAVVLTPKLGSDPVGPVVVHATENCTVPSMDYIVFGVQFLKQAFEVFPGEPNTAKMWAALMGAKYTGHTWNVAVGYTTLMVNSSVKIEMSVSTGKQVQGMLKGDKSKGVLWNIFTSD